MFCNIKSIIPTLLIIWLCLCPSILFAKNIDFKNFKLSGNPDKYQIHTRVEFTLTEYLRKALLNGVALKGRVQFRLSEHNNWWFDKDYPLLTVTYELKYHALSRHFLLSRSDTNEHWNFSSLPASLRKLNAMHRYDLPDINLFKKQEKYSIVGAADMNPANVDFPLRIQSIFSDQYKLTSDGILWPLP